MTKETTIYRAKELSEALFGTPSPNGLSPPGISNSEQAAESVVSDDFAEKIELTATSPTTPDPVPPIRSEPASVIPLNRVLAPFDMVGDLEELRKRIVDSFRVLDPLAQKGRWTVIYAAANAGKTLAVMALLAKMLQEHPEQAKSIYYVNADDNVDGVIDKGTIAAECGFYMLVPGYKDFETHQLPSLLDKLCKSGQAHQTVIIIDTLKKAVDLMKKSQLRVFGECIRRFISQGGTVITLAHTNKNVGPDGKPIPEGTADIINDADCVYLLYEVMREGGTKTVVLECRKTRGGDPAEVYIQYSTEPNLNYQELLSTVEVIDGAALEEFKPVPPPTTEDVIVSAICKAITEGVNTKMCIRDHASEVTGASKREVIRIIEQYTGSDPEVHKWTFTRGERGRQQFQLLPAQLSRISESADSQISGKNGDPTSTQNPTETTITD